MEYETIIGLETHLELSSATKIFCGCPIGFGGEPNSRCCPVCTGQPGALPTLNRRVVEYAVKAGLALNCKVRSCSEMERKNYVYPDLPKAYQISQCALPLCYDGFVPLADGTTIRIKQIHIEEDAGKLRYDGSDILIDYNRSGVPLIEIVTEPDFRSAEQVREYLEQIRLTMKYLEVSDCKMQEGSLRCDVNVSLRPKGTEEFGIRTEIKNVNSVSFIEKAIESERRRQAELLRRGEMVVRQTMRYNETEHRVEVMRRKEDADDYRYFPEPDLLPIVLTQQQIDSLRQTIPELPYEKRERYCRIFKLHRDTAEQLTKYRKIAEYFEEMVKETEQPKASANLILNVLFRFLKTEEEKENAELPFAANAFSEVVDLMTEKRVSRSVIQTVVGTMMEKKMPFDQLFSIDDWKNDSERTEQIIQDVLQKNEAVVADIKNGKEKAIGVLIGAVMRETGGRADASAVAEQIWNQIK